MCNHSKWLLIYMPGAIGKQSNVSWYIEHTQLLQNDESNIQAVFIRYRLDS